ncbi:MAG: glycosyltransferase [Butyrivibrio sp.]|nr:glycosyltransferase [Butyrivibrio sp.]
MSKKQKLISVIVPIYNIEAYIEKCIKSIIGQTYHNLEIILVDDGSADNSGRICDRYAELDNRIMVLHKENGGLSDARNYAIDRAHGDLLAFVDGDDWIHPQMYELMQDAMELHEADVVTCWFERTDKDFGKRQYKQDELNVRLLSGAEALCDIETPLVVAWNKLYKREIFENIRYPKDRLHEDEYIIHRIFYKCRKVAVIDKPLYFYTIRDGSIVSHMTPVRIDNTLEALADRVEFAGNMNWTEVMPAVIKRYCDYCIDRYRDIASGHYDYIERIYLDILWQSEQNMVQKYSNIKIENKYKYFAKSPEEYERWLVKNKKIDKYRNILNRAFNKVKRQAGVKPQA